MVSNKRSRVLCKKLDRIAADCRKVSAATKKRVSIYTHVQRDGTIPITVHPESCKERLEMQRITVELRKQIFINAETNPAGQTSSTINAAGYRKDHYFDGHERMSYGQYTVTAEQVVFGGDPIGLENEIMLKELKRERQKRKQK